MISLLFGDLNNNVSDSIINNKLLNIFDLV